MQNQTLFFNGKIHTLDSDDRVVNSLLTAGGKITALNLSETDMQALPADTNRIDLQHASAVPGFIDTHLHLLTLGNVSQAAYLYDASSVAEVLDLLSQYAARNPEGMVIGYGANFRADLMAEGRLPTAADLDKVASDREVVMFDVNKALVNSYVLNKIPAESLPVATASEHAAGLFYGSTRQLVPIECWQFRSDKARLKDKLLSGLKICAAHGITRIVNASVDLEQLRALRELNEAGELPLHVRALILGVPPAELAAQGLTPGQTKGNLSIGPIKFFWDHMIMHKTAWMNKPYAGEPENYGHARMTPAEFRQVLVDTFDAGWPVGVHTTGDRGLDELAAIFDAEYDRMADLPRSHIIHAYLPTPYALDVCRKRDIAVAVQPDFLRVWGDTLVEHLGMERAAYFLPLKTMLNNELTLSGGSDAPIAWLNVLTAIKTAMLRCSARKQLLGETESLTAREGLALYTTGAAKAMDWEAEVGTLEKGKRANLTVLNRDLPNCNLDDLEGVKVLMTVVDGKPVYQATP